MIVSIIAAMAEANRGIGLRGDLPWRLPADMAHFRELTMGHSVIIGRATWGPIGERGLPGRHVIVLSRSESSIDGADAVAGSLHEALRIASQGGQKAEVFIAGGAQIYLEALEREIVDRMYLTIVHAEVEADAFFPDFEASNWRTVISDERPADERNPHSMTFRLLERI